MNAAGKIHLLKFDPRTKLLLLVLANVVAFTQHALWVEITWVVLLLLLIVGCGCGRSACKLAVAFGICLVLQYYVLPNGPKIVASSFTIIVSYARKIFPCLIVGRDDRAENVDPGIDGRFAKMACPAEFDHSAVGDDALFSCLERRNRLYSRCDEAASYSWLQENRMPAGTDDDLCAANSGRIVCSRCDTRH